MPYIADDKDEEQQAGTPGQIQLSGGASTAEASGPQSSPTAADSKGANTGSGYQNLDKYLQNNNSQQFAGQVAGKVQGQVDSAQQAQASAADKFKGQVSSANQLATDSDVNNAIANPTAADSKQIRRFAEQGYEGPNSLADSSGLNNEFWSGTKNAQNQAQNLGSESGRFALLDQYFGKPTYNYGQKSLDNLLIQQGGVGKQISGLQSQAAQLQAQGQAQSRDLATQAAQRASAVKDNANMVQGRLSDALNQSRGAIDTGLAAANKARNDQYSALQSGIANNKLSPELMKSLGISDGKLYGMSADQVGSYLRKGNDLTSGQFMSPEQKAQLQALSGLAGQSNTYGQGDSTGMSNAFDFDTNAFNTAQQAGKSTYNQALSDLNTRKALAEASTNMSSQIDNSIFGDIGRAFGGGQRNTDTSAQDAIAQQIADLNKRYGGSLGG